MAGIGIGLVTEAFGSGLVAGGAPIFRSSTDAVRFRFSGSNNRRPPMSARTTTTTPAIIAFLEKTDGEPAVGVLKVFDELRDVLGAATGMRTLESLRALCIG